MTHTTLNDKMTTTFLRRLISALLLIISLSLAVNAQTSATDGKTPSGLAPGAPAGSFSLSGFENVNLFNGNLNFSLPLVKIGGRGGAHTGLALTIDSTHWTVERSSDNSGGENEVYNLYNPGNHPPIVGGGNTSYTTFDVSPDLWKQGLRVGYGPGVLQGRWARGPGGSLTRLTFIAPDGTEYELRDVLNNGKPLTSNPRNRGTIFVSASGGTSMTFVSNVAITEPSYYNINSPHSGLTARPSGYLMMADGTRYDITNGLVMAIRDRNGNRITFTYYNDINTPAELWRLHTVTDSLGRVTSVVYAGMAPTNAAYDEIKFKGFGGSDRSIKIWRTNLHNVLRTDRNGDFSTTKTYSQLFSTIYSGTYGGSTNNSTFDPADTVSVVEMPDGRKYYLYYNVYRELARVILPTGGMIEYDYSTIEESVTSNEDSFQINRRVKQRRVYRDAQTLESKQTYAASYFLESTNGTYEFWRTEVMVEQHDMLLAANDTLVSKARHTFFGSPIPSLYQSPTSYSQWTEGKEKLVDTFDKYGTPLRREEMLFSQCTDCEVSIDWWTNPAESGHTADNAPANNPHVVESITTLQDVSPNLVTKQKFVYDKYNNTIRSEDYGFATSAANCSVVRRTESTFLNSTAYIEAAAHLRSLTTRVSIYDSDNIERARTTYEYDNYTPDTGSYHAALVTYSPDVISGRDASFTSERRGNPTSTSYWLLSASGAEIRSFSNYEQFDINGNAVTFVDPLNNRTTYDFADNFGSPNDNEARTNTPPTSLGANRTYSIVKKVTNALSQSAYTQYDYWSGVPVNSEDANNVVSSTFYDDILNRPTKLIAAAGTSFQNQVSISYQDNDHLVTSTSDLSEYGDNLRKVQALYDGLGRPIESRAYENSTDCIRTKQEYDGFGRVKRASSPYRTTDDPTYGWTETSYDALGRVILVKLPDGTQVTTIFNGNTVTVRDQASKQRRSTTDAQGRLISLDEMYEFPSSTVYATSNYTYDALDNFTGVSQGVQSRSFAYDSLKRLVSATNPESGTISYSYDDNNNRLQETDPRLLPNGSTNIKTTLTYDALNRLMARTYNDGTPTVNYYYDNQALPAGAPTLERGASVGQLLAVTYGGGSAGSYYGFDAIGRTTQSAQITNGQTYEMSYGYNLTGIMTRQTYPSGRTMTTAFDTIGRLSSMGGQRNGEAFKQYVSQLSYAPDGSTKSLQLGNGLWEHTSLNKRWQTTEIGVGTSSSDSSVLRLAYYYGTSNNNGSLRTQTIHVPGLSPMTQNYTYDHVNRLTTAEENNGSSWRQTFSYDQYGNRNFVTGQTTPTLLGSNPTYNPNNNRIAANQGYIYDAAGSVTADAQGHTYAYDAEGRQVSYDSGFAAYTYDGAGQRVKKVIGAVTTISVYNAVGQMVAEYDNGNLPPSSSGTTYVSSDSLGSARLLTTGQAAVKARHDYAPFGEELTPTLGGRSSQQQYVLDDLRHKFAGQERDSETGLDYLRARYYQSNQGRFTSADPLLASGTTSNPQTWNRYAYVMNNPVNFTDPSGLKAHGQGMGDCQGVWYQSYGGPTVTVSYAIIPPTTPESEPEPSAPPEPTQPPLAPWAQRELEESIRELFASFETDQEKNVPAETERQKQDAITNIGYHLTKEIYDAFMNHNYSGQTYEFIACWAAVESSLNPRAIGRNAPEKERGLFQLKLSSAREIQNKVTIKQLYDPDVNTRIGTTILRNLISEFGSARTALVVYKEGRGNYSKYGETINSTIYANGIIGCSTATWSVPWR